MEQVEQKLRQLLQRSEAETTPAQSLPCSEEQEPAPKTFDPNARPPRLAGLSWGEIVTLQSDGNFLTEAEEEWLSFKNVPNPDGSMRMPNIKALMRRTHRESEKS
jgi:hypothetical protein